MSSIHEELVSLLREVNRGLGKYPRQVLSEHGIPFSMMMISKQIKAEPGITISELARRTGIAKSHISNSIRDFDQRGWVEKRSDASDQRILRLYLTPSATEELALVGTKIRENLNALVADIPEQRARELVEGLSEIKSALEKYQENNSLEPFCKE